MDLSSLIKMPDPTAVREVVREPEPSTILSPLIEDLSLTRDRLAFLDRKAATMSDTEWMILIAQLRASPEVAMEVLGMDSTHPSFDEEIEERIRRRNSALSDIHYRAQQDKIMSQGDSTEYMRSELKKLEDEFYRLKAIGTDVQAYNVRFQELSLMCTRMYADEAELVEKYIGGLPSMIHDGVWSTKPTSTQVSMESAVELIYKKVESFAERQSEKKRKPEGTALLHKLGKASLLLENKAKFICEFVEGTIVVSNKKKDDMYAELKVKGFTPLPKETVLEVSISGVVDHVGREETEEVAPGTKYDYLLSMAIASLTYEKMHKLQKNEETMENARS
ncbi:reverse transcriptase domain-containing protein [Tanacetum coccineum]